ncbi:hypothetical protein ACQKP8_03230 [Photobacterium alginatilyticum]|uniref:hypothetical protein n=1 Tax=Photobacterium alginatilyticum TaxID=1775171 RepID=UPI0040691D07
MEKKWLVFPAVALLMHGCGGDSNNTSATGNSTTNPTSDSITYTAIDGYLGSAAVYADRNADLIADDDEYIGLTNSNGRITLSATDSQYDVIVKIIAGQTTDSDINGTVAHSVEMVAQAGEQVISPLSTLARLQNMSLADLANELNLNPDDVAGDFIANNHKSVHVINRSTNLRLGTTLQQTKNDVATIKSDTQKIVQYVQNQISDTSELNDLVLTIDDNGIITKSTPEDVHNPSFDLANMTLQWEQKNFSGVNYQDFHPCYTAFWGDVIAVGNCSSDKFITLSMADGKVNSVSETGDYTNDRSWYIDGEYLAIVHADNSITYLSKNLKPANPSANELQYANAQLIKQANYGYFYKGSDPKITDIINSQSYITFKNEDTLTGELNHYNTTTGELTTLNSNLSRTSKSLATEQALKKIVISAHNSSDLSLYAHESNTAITWLVDDIFIARVDNDSDLGRVSNDHHYMVIGDKAIYLGRMYAGTWYLGADKSSVIYYTAYKGQGNEDHRFIQYSLKDGKQKASWTKTMAELKPNLYSQKHSRAGIISISDSYSSVTLLK